MEDENDNITTMTTATTKIKNGSITLPEELRKQWTGADVYISGEKNTLFIKRLSKPALTLKEMLHEFREAARKTKLSKKDAESAVRETRKEIYA